MWRCNKKYEIKGENGCGNRHIDDKVLYHAFIITFNAIIENNEHFLEKWKSEDSDVLKKYKAKQFIKIIENAEMIEEFDIDIYYKIIEKITVHQDNKIIVVLLDGTEIECEIE